MNKGMIHIYCGNGKGKTTAAVGLCARFAGSGKNALFAYFLKGQNSSEIPSLQKLGVTIIKPVQPKKFIPYMNEWELAECKQAQRLCIREITDLLKTGEYGMLVLDEILDAVSLNIIEETDVLSIIKNYPDTEVVLTGRNPSPALADIADYISRIEPVRHPYEKGISARLGIEY
ncbi:MAG: hypothetical protein BGN88_03035 [Clostridiales bacterium 43-6]|nr:MAG: hypothetical protein BGN88_03035 [Clostridiales bacterium 43-6]